MKIPTTHINTKHTVMFAGALVAAVGFTPTVALAHGGGDARDGRSGHSSGDRGNDSHADNTARWWNWFSVENFQTRHDAKMAKLNAFVTDNNLTVENQAALQADIKTKATAVKTEITAFANLKGTIDKNNITEEQKQALKAQAQKAFDAFRAYHDSVKTYKTAIKVAADAAGVSFETKLDHDTSDKD
ncbi:MAG: hypothetical protein JWM00_754 [Candidatus Saccharibacteria bacterium]|nr:hypothetical protein [Candidatus Saccharibacteria bacterium]